jgi:hypothetical protein
VLSGVILRSGEAATKNLTCGLPTTRFFAPLRMTERLPGTAAATGIDRGGFA